MSGEPYADYDQIADTIADGGVARTVEVRSDLLVDVDAAGRVLGVERIGDRVRQRDLEDVLRVAVIPKETV